MAMPTGTRALVGDRRQQQPLQQPARKDLADLRIGQPLLRQELLVGLLAELAVEALGVRHLRDFRIDQPLRQREAVFVGERDQRLLWSISALEDRRQVADDAGIVGVRPLLARRPAAAAASLRSCRDR